MFDKPLFSFVITCFNYGRYLGDCLDSILHQEITEEYEIIVVDDASTDNTPQVARTWSGHPISFVRLPENRGLKAAIEEGLGRTRGTFVKHLDADDRLSAGYLERVMPAFERHPHVGAVYGDIAAIDENGRILENPWSAIRSHAVHGNREFVGDEYLALLQENFCPWPSLMARRSALDSVLPLPDWLPKRFGPMDWYLNLAIARDHELCYLPETLAEYRLHAHNNHAKAPTDRSREAGVFQLFNHLFAEADRAAEKRRIRRRVYGYAYDYFGTRYLNAGMLAEAQRCYRKSVSYAPQLLGRFAWWRRLLAAHLGPERYNMLKSRLFDRSD